MYSQYRSLIEFASRFALPAVCTCYNSRARGHGALTELKRFSLCVVARSLAGILREIGRLVIRSDGITAIDIEESTNHELARRASHIGDKSSDVIRMGEFVS
jgi:hypothetical protein